MYSSQLIELIVNLLAPEGYIERSASEGNYLPRRLPEKAVVTRSAPSPTGFVHIGTIYMSLINKLVALSSGGVNILRIEDTDKKREVENGVKEIVDMLATFDLQPQEGVDSQSQSFGDYGPYIQSQRAKIYLGYAIDLLKNDRAYVCFATPEELEANYEQQQAQKVRPGYYGEWALWRNKSEDDVTKALNANKKFVLRLKSAGSHQKRIVLNDMLKGRLELPENDLDVPLIKSDKFRLPTYHLAHVVDDHLMQTNIILRGDEWLTSTPLHIELCQALGIKPYRYAHFAPINIMDGNSRRKLSKRKDPEANAKYFLSDGYPPLAVLEYLVGLANSNFEEWRINNLDKTIWDFPFSFEKWAKSRGALLDLKKLADVSKNYISLLNQADFEAALKTWAEIFDEEFLNVLNTDSSYSQKVLSIEREGGQRRKDISHWAEARDQYGFFFDVCFAKVDWSLIEKEYLGDFNAEIIKQVCTAVVRFYDDIDDQNVWFDKFKAAADGCGFATDNQQFKSKPARFKGNLADFARIIRVKLSAKNKTPDLYLVMQVLGSDRVKKRLN